MTTQRPAEIRASHLARDAVVYLRQSTEEQVVRHQGSTAFQQAQADYARAYGWPEPRIVDGDLGKSGAAAEHRTAYQQLLRDTADNLVGAIFVSDLTRLGRDLPELVRLFELCRQHDVLIVVNGRVHDPRDSNQLLLTQIVAAVGQHDNAKRTESMMNARRQKAREGKAVSKPPTGYVRMPDGTWVMDPDPAVRSALAAALRIFGEERSLVRTVKRMKAEGIKIPRRGAR